MFKQTRNLPAEAFDRLTEDVGGANNAATGDDATSYHEVVPANHLERLLFAEADRMAALVVDRAAFASERDVVEAELRQRTLAEPYGQLLTIDYPALAYATHPYPRPGIGNLADLQAAPIDEARAFHALYYRPTMRCWSSPAISIRRSSTAGSSATSPRSHVPPGRFRA